MRTFRCWIVAVSVVASSFAVGPRSSFAVLKHHWTLDDTAASGIAVDSAGGKNGTFAIGGGVTSETGIVGGALLFAGPSSATSHVAITNFDTTGLSTLTVAFWMKPTINMATAQFKRVISSVDQFEAVLQQNTGQLGNNFHVLGATYPLSPTGVVENEWIHVAMTSVAGTPAAGGPMEIYVNGVEVAENLTRATDLYSTATAEIRFGHRPGSADNQRFTGLLDDIRIYDTILSPTEIAELANVAQPNPLTLIVNTTDGNVSIKNVNPSVPASESLIGYKIGSSVNGLVPGPGPNSWNSLADQHIDESTNPSGDFDLSGTVDAADYVFWRKNINTPTAYQQWRATFGDTGGGTEPGNGWDESGGSNASQLIELRLTGQSTLNVNESFPLGKAYNTSIADMNLTFEYWRPGGTKVIGLIDYVTSGSAAALAVPEPASLWLLMCGFIALVFRRVRIVTLAVVCGPFLMTSSVEAVEIHRYTFNNGTASDSIGSANGTLVNTQGINRYAAGQLNLRGNHSVFNAQLNSGQDYTLPAARGAYLDLPNSIISAAFGGAPDGIAGNLIGAASFEIWYTMDTNRNSARAWHFGHQDGGVEDSPTVNTGGNGSADIGLEPQAAVTGVNRLRFQSRFNDTSTLNPAVTVPVDYAGFPSPVGVQQHVVVTLDHDDFSAGANGTAKVYVDGSATPAVTGPIAAGLFLETFSPFGDLNNWLGRSMFAANPLFDGSINEFRIHTGAMTGTQINTNFTNGPTLAGTPSAPTLTVHRNTGAVSLLNEEGAAFEVTNYSIRSPSGSLNPIGWTSLDDGSTTWSESSATVSELTESETGVGTAGSLTPGVPLSLGNAYLPSPFEDLWFTYTLSNGASGGGFVKYDGTTLVRSDLDGNGLVNTADWAIFLANNATSLAGSSAAVAYRKGDLDFDLDNDFTDFLLFRSDYIAANGAAAFLALSHSVPEPSTIVLVVAGAIGLIFRKEGLRSD